MRSTNENGESAYVCIVPYYNAIEVKWGEMKWSEVKWKILIQEYRVDIANASSFSMKI